ncbi:heterokaryon incompatibility, partial [Clohesyomyces aquaticus]
DTETIRGRMRRMVLTGIPKYDALSYVWGRPDPLSPKTLEVNGGVLKITTNLHAALTAVMKGSANLTIWVDAVCINQEDLLERNQQVAMMSQIYKSATTVRIYLG